MTTDRTIKALLFAVALAVWSVLIVAVATRNQEDYSYDLQTITSKLDEIDQRLSSLDERAVSLDADLSTMKSDMESIESSIRLLTYR